VSTKAQSKILTILISLLIGYLAGIGAFAYFLQQYGYPVENPLAVQPTRPRQPHQNAWLRDQIEQLRPLTEQTQPQTQQLADAQSESEHGVVPPIVPESLVKIADDVLELRQRHLLLPLSNLRKEDLRDSFDESRGNHHHEAIDIPAPRNTAILAVEDGSIARLWLSLPGGITIYQFDQEHKYEYYYAHLERYAEGLKEGDHMKRGQVIGYVGTSGNAPKNAPHLHFTIFKLTEQKQWWEGTAIDPYLIYGRS
jgi:murein DD-endopeptidase MepM/ murein hydrolase activator NlpD